MKTIVCSLLYILAATHCYAKTLVISDIDDTIKISHVRSLEKFVNAVDPLKEFSGMSELYLSLERFYDKNKEVVKFSYVSNAPVAAMYVSHYSFLYLNNFPTGDLLLKESLLVENHKVETIKKMIAEEKPQTVIMIGDNGEIDSQVYNEITTYFADPTIKFYTFIHQVYATTDAEESGHPLLKNQNGFVTALDLGVSLQNIGLIDHAGFEEFWKKTSSSIIFEKEGFFESDVFPDWMKCKDYFQEKNISSKTLGSYLDALLVKKCN